MEIRELYDNLMEAIGEIDTALDSLSDSSTVGKRKVTNDLVAKHETVWSGPLGDLVEFVSGQSIEVQTAVVSAFQATLRKEFDKAISSYVEGVVESQPVQEPLITEDEAAVYSEKRSEIYKKLKSIVELADSIGEEGYEMPRMRRGSTGKRGPRNLSLFTFWIDDEEVDMTIGQIAKDNGYEKAKDLTEALRESGFDTKDGDSFDSFTLPNGKVLSGQRDDEEESDES